MGLDAACGEPDCDGDGHEAAPRGEDCDDADAAVSPDATEICGNLVDDDCDGRTDLGCATAGPPDPGGIAWTCGVGGVPSWAFVAVAIVSVLARRGRGAVSCQLSAVSQRGGVFRRLRLWLRAESCELRASS